MEITLEAIISFLGLFIGGGGGAFFTWRYMRRKAKAEAVTAEVDAAKDMQDMYQQMLQDAKTDREDRRQQVEELRQERDHYKRDRNEMREQLEKLTKNVSEWKQTSDDRIQDLQRQVARNGRQLESMRPFMCGDLSCKLRQPVIISAEGEVRTKRAPNKKKDIEPVESEAL